MENIQLYIALSHEEQEYLDNLQLILGILPDNENNERINYLFSIYLGISTKIGQISWTFSIYLQMPWEACHHS
ncbi:hypothetical protein A8709_09990 [Paenibacillus pectinilyticus]|uniref:Uncharacterized protein n=1 Tax=Paenibacillus pectinilyticus TaxID=512399 RepID=A0A1C1A610_9BACL|nr:hypothetical protein [Paenibacillus pectinilyticus]OCT15941.1 hypothetical protein A8709_09990 [Paenibacillus pectinilyticus]